MISLRGKNHIQLVHCGFIIMSHLLFYQSLHFHSTFRRTSRSRFFCVFFKCFDQMWLNEEARIAQVANINQLPGTDGFTSPPKDAVMNTSSFLRVELSTLIGEKSLIKQPDSLNLRRNLWIQTRLTTLPLLSLEL